MSKDINNPFEDDEVKEAIQEAELQIEQQETRITFLQKKIDLAIWHLKQSRPYEAREVLEMNKLSEKVNVKELINE